MRRTAFCCIALVAACGFDGSTGSDEGSAPVSPAPPVEPLPSGTLRVSGRVASPEVGGYVHVALLLPPPGTPLPATSPCIPQGAHVVAVDMTPQPGGSGGSFSFSNVAADDYLLVAYRFGEGFRTFERTMRPVTVNATATNVGEFALPPTLLVKASESDVLAAARGPGSDDKVSWTAPTGFLTSAFDVTRKLSVCERGKELSVQGTYEVSPKGDEREIKVVVESDMVDPQIGRQMAITLATPDRD
jgi:hypothetical protein